MELKTIGKIERLSPELDGIVNPNARIQVLGTGYAWSEGPVWVKSGGFLLFSDVPANTVYQYREGQDVRPFLKPSGYTGTKSRGGESGSNGLTLDRQGRLLLCQHGDRRVARLDSPLLVDEMPAAKFTTIADKWEGKRFNSPNDLVVHSSGAVYFTDPPYGIEKGGDASTKEIPFSGVYRVAPDGNVTMLTKYLDRPNGLAFSPDEKTLYVANSDPDKPIWMAYAVRADGTLQDGRVFMSGGSLARAGKQGLPDGFRVAENGCLLASGPGGVLVISPAGKLLGTIVTGTAISNCAFGDDGRTLYITAHMHLCRVKLKVKGAGF
jgi:gluconolactonase